MKNQKNKLNIHTYNKRWKLKPIEIKETSKCQSKPSRASHCTYSLKRQKS